MATTPLHRPSSNPSPVAQVLSGCGVLRAIAERARTATSLDHGSFLALRHTLGHLADGPRFVNELLRRLSGIRADQLLNTRLGGPPTSCAQLRRRVPDEDRFRCTDCEFNLEAGAYPTPVLHAGDEGDDALRRAGGRG